MGVIGPGVRRAVQITRNRRIGVIATPATINSGAYVRAVERLDPAIEVVGQACPLFVPLVEEGWFEDDVTAAVARKYLRSMREAGVDTLILGCTHYPLLTPVLRGVMGTGVMLVDSAERVALEVKAALGRDGRNRSRRSKAHYRFLVSDDPGHFQKLARRFLGRRVENVERVRMG
jgi:glutamate racemase